VTRNLDQHFQSQYAELSKLPALARAAFATSIAQRVFDDCERSSDYGEKWRLHIAALWRAVDDEPGAFREVSDAVAELLP
jgi:hypothetical protein